MQKLQYFFDASKYILDLCSNNKYVFVCGLTFNRPSTQLYLEEEVLDKLTQTFVDGLLNNLKENQSLVILRGVLSLVHIESTRKMPDEVKKEIQATIDTFKKQNDLIFCDHSIVCRRFYDRLSKEFIDDIYRKGFFYIAPSVKKSSGKLRPANIESNKWTKEELKKIKIEFKEASEKIAEYIEQPRLLDKTIHYAASLLKWRKAGYPIRTENEVAEIIKICHSCDKFDPEKDVCKICGCSVSLVGWAIKNKAKMGTEHCSDKKEPKW